MDATRTRRRRRGILAGGVAFVLALIAHSATAADQVVTDFGDTGRADQLRRKIEEAQNSGGGTITFAGSGTVILSGTPLPTIIGNITIDGAPGVTLSGGNASRILNVATGADLRLRNLTLTRGYSANGDGGAVYADGALRIERCRFIQNRTLPQYSGGGIVAYGSLVITNTEFASNTAGGGGAVYARFAASVFIVDCDFHDNQAEGDIGGGAILLWDGARGPANRTLFRNNKAAQAGGAVYVTPNSTFDAGESTFTGNSSQTRGGAISNHGTLSSFKTTMTGNFSGQLVDSRGGTIYNAPLATTSVILSRLAGNPSAGTISAANGGAIFNEGNLRVLSSTLDGHKAGIGGAIYHGAAATTELQNVTLSGNTAIASFGGGGIAAMGKNAGSVKLTNVTLAGNSSSQPGGVGGITGDPVVYSLRNTLFVRGSSGANCSFSGTAAPAGEFNLSDDGTCRLGSGRENVNALLGPLQDNGGLTPTHLPQPGSPAIDNGTSSDAPLRDQRSYLRAGAAPDVGAVEFAGVFPSTLANISTRVRVETGENALIGGFIVTGDQPRRLIARAIGPSLGFAGTLADPQLALYNAAGELLASNNNWQDAPNRQEIIDSTVAPSHQAESAILGSLAPGAYTAIVSGVNDGTGIALVELYDLDRPSGSKLANISSRGVVQTGDDVMIGGFIVRGPDQQRVIIRAIGPSLPVAGALADPTLEIYDSNGILRESNNDWRKGNEGGVIATTIPPTNDLESAVVGFLSPGAYTAIVRGVANTTGVGLVEVYALDD